MARRIPADRFDRLVRGATEVLIERGYRRTQMADVAEAIGVVHVRGALAHVAEAIGVVHVRGEHRAGAGLGQARGRVVAHAREQAQVLLEDHGELVAAHVERDGPRRAAPVPHEAQVAPQPAVRVAPPRRVRRDRLDRRQLLGRRRDPLDLAHRVGPRVRIRESVVSGTQLNPSMLVPGMRGGGVSSVEISSSSSNTLRT